MAPDADTLRNRQVVHPVPDNAHLATQQVRTLQSLASTEVVIDGIIYDITSFDHPGGESIRIFGGNDATVLYKMIHPHHHSNRHLEKMKIVGRIPDYYCEYKFDTPFERELKKEVFQIVQRGKVYGTPGYMFRAAGYVALFFYLQYRWMQHTSYPLAILYGVSMALIGLNVQHDANHGAASRKVWVNDLLGLGADLIGGSKWIWMEKHWTHHAYTNHKDHDPDGTAAEPMLLFNDYPLHSPKRAFYHTYQAFYAIAVLSLYWLSSVVDFAQVWTLRDRGATKAGMNFRGNPWIERNIKYSIGLRLFHIVCNVIVPLHSSFSLETFAHIHVMGMAGSLFLGLLFTLSHNFEHVERDPTMHARMTDEPVCWCKSQVETSSTYGGMLAGWITGGLNFQVEHHLFPRMSSAWYPYVAPVVRRVCEKHGVKYAYYPWVWQNMWSSFRYVNEIGTAAKWKGNPFEGDL